MGVSGSGKSHVGRLLAERLGVEFIDGDDYHPQANIDKMARGIPLDDDDRQGWLDTLAGLIADHHRRDASLVIGCSALKRRYRNLLRGGDPALDILFLEGSREQLLERLTSREGHFFTGEAMLESQLTDLEPPGDDEAIALNISEPPEALVSAFLAAPPLRRSAPC